MSILASIELRNLEIRKRELKLMKMEWEEIMSKISPIFFQTMKLSIYLLCLQSPYHKLFGFVMKIV